MQAEEQFILTFKQLSNMNYQEKYEALLTQFEQYKKESVKWCAEDVLWCAQDNYSQTLTKEEAQEILERMIHFHDAEIGITWDTIRAYIDVHFNL
jgi:hypothetical protein